MLTPKTARSNKYDTKYITNDEEITACNATIFYTYNKQHIDHMGSVFGDL